MKVETFSVSLKDGTYINISNCSVDTAAKLLALLDEFENHPVAYMSEKVNSIETAKVAVRNIIHNNKNQKIPAIKRYREIMGCGLKEAKDAVENIMYTEFGIPYPHTVNSY